jgi:hypothetical protein
MRARDITEFTAPIDRFFNFCHDAKNIGTIGIGDGGNEIGARVVCARGGACRVHFSRWGAQVWAR